MKILDYDEIFFQDWIQESKDFVAKRDKIPLPNPTGNPALSKLKRQAEDLETDLADPAIILQAKKDFQNLLNDERSKRIQNSLKREEFNRKLENGNKPIIDYFLQTRDEALQRLSRLIIFDSGIKTKNNLSDKPLVRVEVRTNLNQINFAREELYSVNRIRDLIHHSGGIIFDAMRVIAEKVNAIDFRKTEVVTMSLSSVTEMEEVLKGGPPTISPELMRSAAQSELEGRMDKVKQRLADLIS